MNKFLTAACAATLLSTTALAGERQVEVELPKTITITCSDSVRPGTVVLTNPPKFSCADYDVVKRVMGTGITVGPDTRISRIIRAVRRVEKPSRTTTVASTGSWKDIPQRPRRSGYERGAWQPLDDFDRRFPGINRNQAWFEKTGKTKNFLTESSNTSECSGWVNVSDLLQGRCKDVKVRVN